MYPKEVLTTNQAGKTEARVLLDQGKYTRYKYIDQKTGKGNTKVSILLDSAKGKEHYFLIPLKQGKKLMIYDKSMKSENKAVFNQKTKEVVKI